ncbi:MAG: hypothetical protein B7X87_13980 [Hydrogenophilales bacterium 17-64-34]|nr:MAG: hypothetical protein B7X87_13980 [Hydrogenophilales bacterium 17-64-34]
MPEVRISVLVALALSLGVHAGLLALWAVKAQRPAASAVSASLQVNLMSTPAQQREPVPKAARAETARIEQPAKPRANPAIPSPSGAEVQEHVRVTASIPPSPTPEKQLASMPAPPAPTAAEWALASTYTLKNSKRYRYNWGQQVRSMMGTAIEGPGQGAVRFRIEIAPDGKISKVEELWSTSEVVSKLAREAIQNLPPLPPISTGKPLIFEQTISFQPYETGWPPSYKLDCLPEPLPFNNPFAWGHDRRRRKIVQAPDGSMAVGALNGID